MMSGTRIGGAILQHGKSGRYMSYLLSGLLCCLLLVCVYFMRDPIWAWLNHPVSWAVVIASFVVALLPAAICFSQTVTRKRLIAKLQSVDDLQIGRTVYFIGASKSFDSIVPAVITGDYFFPLVMNVATNCFLFLLLLNGFTYRDFIDYPNVILLGIQPVSKTFDVQTYQMGTFSVMTAAFLGNYIYTLSQLLSRVNNNDLLPISLHFYSARTIIAMTTACMVRHTMNAFGVTGSDVVLLLGFAAGLAPDLLIVALSRRAFQYLKVWGSRADPDPVFRPTSLALLEIDELTRDKIDRLSELGIDSAHALSRQNPFIIWAKLPYDLGLIIDWIAQAQLYVIVRDEAFSKLRTSLVTDIFDFVCRLEGDDPGAVLGAAGLAPAAGATLQKQFQSDEAYQRLLQVRLALLPKNYLVAPALGAQSDSPPRQPLRRKEEVLLEAFGPIHGDE